MKKRRIIQILLLVLLAVSLFSCGVDYTDEDLQGALEELLPKSYELNVIYFGDGLEVSKDWEKMKEFRETTGLSSTTTEYLPVDEDCGYTSEAEIREETLRVFSAEYAEVLFERAFVGISSIRNEGEENQVKEIASFARYIEENGYLTVRDGLEEESLPVDRRFDTSKMVVEKKRKNYAVVLLPVISDEETIEKFRLVRESDGWKLDCPTY